VNYHLLQQAWIFYVLVVLGGSADIVTNGGSCN